MRQSHNSQQIITNNSISKCDFLNQPQLTHKMAYWHSITASETMKYYSDFSRQLHICVTMSHKLQWNGCYMYEDRGH